MVKGPYSGIDKSSPLGESLEDFLNDTVAPTLDGQRPNWSEFTNVMDRGEIERLRDKTNGKEELIKRKDEDWETGVLGEWVVLQGLRSGWFGGAEVEAHPTSKYDDYFKGTDIVCEFKVGEEVVPLAIDITTADATGGRDPMRAAATIYNKIERIEKRAKQGLHPGVLEFHKSHMGEGRIIGRDEMLKAVVVLSPADVFRLSELTRRIFEDGDEGAREELVNDSSRYDVLAQILAAIRQSREFASKVVRAQGQGKTKEEINIASQVISEAETLEKILEEVGSQGELKIENQLVDLIYTGRVPEELLKAIKEKKLDDVFI
ncbi:MAG: hypothetical protein WD883_02520 [Candidatus Colwellbacteria bacterium]